MAIKACASCGKAFTAQRSTAKFCSSTCRVHGARDLPVALPAPVAPSSGLSAVTERTLAEAGVLDTIAGQQALTLARRIESPHETGAAVASMSKQLQAVLVEAMRSVQSEDRLDELRTRRDLKRSAG